MNEIVNIIDRRAGARGGRVCCVGRPVESVQSDRAEAENRRNEMQDGERYACRRDVAPRSAFATRERRIEVITSPFEDKRDILCFFRHIIGSADPAGPLIPARFSIRPPLRSHTSTVATDELGVRDGRDSKSENHQKFRNSHVYGPHDTPRSCSWNNVLRRSLRLSFIKKKKRSLPTPPPRIFHIFPMREDIARLSRGDPPVRTVDVSAEERRRIWRVLDRSAFSFSSFPLSRRSRRVTTKDGRKVRFPVAHATI